MFLNERINKMGEFPLHCPHMNCGYCYACSKEIWNEKQKLVQSSEVINWLKTFLTVTPFEEAKSDYLDMLIDNGYVKEYLLAEDASSSYIVISKKGLRVLVDFDLI
jgi:hypothetical protein